MPNAMLVVNMVTIIMCKPASPANAEPTIMPSSIKVESNNVLMKNLRIMGPTLSCLSVSRRRFTCCTFFGRINVNVVISALLGVFLFTPQINN